VRISVAEGIGEYQESADRNFWRFEWLIRP
jgi:hypothetical protein